MERKNWEEEKERDEDEENDRAAVKWIIVIVAPLYILMHN